MQTFMFRTKEIRRIHQSFSEGRSVLLVGIRRTGKTRLMEEVLRRWDQTATHYVNVADYTRLDVFYAELLNVLPKSVMQNAWDILMHAGRVPSKLMQWLRSHFDKVGLAGVEVDFNAPEQQANLLRYWESLVPALLDSLRATPAQNVPVIAIDELPFMLENLVDRGVTIADMTVALASLRKLRDAGLRMVIGGSISLENFLTLHGIPHTVLGGLDREVLPPFTRDEAQGYLESRLEGCPAGQAIGKILNKLPDHVPHYLVESVRYLKVLDSADDVEWTMDNEVLPSIRRSFLKQFQERLNKNYSDEELQTAQAILDHVAQQKTQACTINLAVYPAHANRVLTKLQYDMFLQEAPGFGFCFSLQLLRLWWQNQRGLVV